jgi:hypothetical protein
VAYPEDPEISILYVPLNLAGSIVPATIPEASNKLVAFVAVPVRSPAKVVAVTTPVKYPSPSTVSFDVGSVVPIPTLEIVLIPTEVDCQ